MEQGAFLLNADGTARDPRAFQTALRSDQEKLTVLQSDPDVLNTILGEHVPAMQNLLRAAFQTEQTRRKSRQKRLSERTIDAQRADATIPRDTVQLYEQLYESGLQYGPAFRLLRNVHVPDPQDSNR